LADCWSWLIERAIRKSRYRRADFFVGKMADVLPPAGSSLLDLGCGTLHLGARLAERGLKVTALDARPHLGYVNLWLIGVPCARRVAARHGIDYRHYDGQRLPFPDQSFDVVLLAFVLHHAANWPTVLDEAVRVSKRGVILLEDTPETPAERLRNSVSDALMNLQLVGGGEKKTVRGWLGEFRRRGLAVMRHVSWIYSHGPLRFCDTMFFVEK